jgi:choline dehydrogenase-like flavoprotein
VAERIAVIGGGYAGFAAAVTLAQAGRAVTVFEAAQTLGGRARRIEAYEVVVDNGEHMLLGAYTELLALLRTVHGPGAERDLLDRRQLCLAEPGVFRLAAPRLPAPGIRAGAVAHKALPGPSAARRSRSSVDCGATGIAVRRHDGGRAPRWAASGIDTKSVEPLCIAALNTPLAVASAQIFLNVLAAAFAARPTIRTR